MIINVTPDKQKAKSMLNLIDIRMRFISSAEENKFPTIAAENYYEIIKELSASILLLNGVKTIGENAHKELIEYLSKYKELEEQEIRTIDDLRIKRNKSCYEGKEIELNYIINKKDTLLKIIDKLKNALNKKL